MAGTNGKGSVCAFLDSALREAGLRVGRYISPTLYDYRERIQIDGQYISKQAVASLLTTIQQACVQMERQGLEPPTVFEVETALAFLYFAEQHCDYVLLEVGMGGRLDSTNVITQPVLSVITPISLDHTRMLGDHLAAIAAEKGGIVKPHCPAVLGPQQPEAQAVLTARCQQCGITPLQVDVNQIQKQQWSWQGQRFFLWALVPAYHWLVRRLSARQRGHCHRSLTTAAKGGARFNRRSNTGWFGQSPLARPV